MLIMDIIKQVFFIVVLIQLSQCFNYYYKYVDEIGENNNDQFTWLVVISDKNDESMYKVSYGSLIHFKAVLTSAQTIRGYAAENLIVETKCQLATKIDDKELPYLINCKSRDVKKIIYQDSSDNQNSKKKYAILILKKRFETTDEVSFINVAKSLDDIDGKNCFIPRWMRLYENSSGRKRLVTVLYNKNIRNEHFNPKFLDPEQLKIDTDHIIGRQFHQSLDDNTTTVSYEYNGYQIGIKTNRLNFLGSPFVCKLIETLDYVQIGIATYRFTINTFRFLEGGFNLHQNGSLFTIYQFRQKIMETVHENLLTCRTICQEYCSYD